MKSALSFMIDEYWSSRTAAGKLVFIWVWPIIIPFALMADTFDWLEKHTRKL